MRSVCRLALIAACSAWPLAAIGSGDDVELRGSVHAGARPVPHAAVWLTASSRPGTVQPRKVVLDQRNLTFTPRILIVQVGATVELPNNDRVFHNVFSFRDGKRFDLGLYPVGAVRRVTFDRPGVSRIFCNIHPNMAAYVVAVDTPYHAVADEEGRFSIPSVIRGTYTYHAWRPGAEELTGSAAVDEQRSLDIRWP